MMSYCESRGKDKIIFAGPDLLETPSTISIPEDEEPAGLILPNGEINWDCPCLGGMTTGPCGFEFRKAVSCFHYSKEEPKGKDCISVFQEMGNCMKQYPNLYPNEDESEESDKKDNLSSAPSVETQPPDSSETLNSESK